ncbi:MAG TPA: AMP-binding protein [Thermodesulfobacteriota bacterium]|nr:AMP-binding protein [Thermodesulfobacteriota bacterium]
MKFQSIRESIGIFPLNAMLERSARIYGSNMALRKRTSHGWRQYTYSELLSSVKRVANYLRKNGYRKGDFIGIIGENSPEWVISFMAIQWIGGIAIPLDPRAREMELRHIFDHSEVRAVFSSVRNLAQLNRMKESGDLKRDTLIISMEETENDNCLPRILSDFKDDAEREKVGLEDLVIVQYTSGTTGSPKGVMLTHKNISSNIHSLYQAVLFDQKDRFFSVLPIHHVYEGTTGNWLPLSVGASITYSRSLKSKEMIEDAREAEPTVMLAVPLLLEKMLLGIKKRLDGSPGYFKGFMVLLKGSATLFNCLQKRAGSRLIFRGLRKKMGFGRLRFFVSGGAALPSWVQKGLEDYGFIVLQGYGLSETSPVLTLNPLQETLAGSVGLPIPGVEIRIVDPDSEGIGEIGAQGGNVMRGYYKNEDATRGVFTSDGFFLTGDMGYEDKDGFLFITGRRKSIIVTKGGENIFPEEIENLMQQSPLIEEILVVRGHSKAGDEEVQAIIYPNLDQLNRHFLKEGIEGSKDQEIRKALQKEIAERGKKLAAYKRIMHFTIRTEEFPKTTTNKIKRYLFEQQDLLRK